MQRLIILLFVMILAIPAVAQEDQTQQDPPQEKTSLHWINGITAGANPWPTSKEKLRLGYIWEASQNTYILHELAFINAENVFDLFGTESRYGTLEGFQIRNELRFFPSSSRHSRFYYGPALAYMFTQHQYKEVEGVDCDTNGNCAYFRRYNEDVAAHTTTASIVGGLLVPVGKTFHFNFHTGIGIRGTYYPGRKTDAYFGKGLVYADSENFVLEPNLRLGVTLLFALKKRKDESEL